MTPLIVETVDERGVVVVMELDSMIVDNNLHVVRELELMNRGEVNEVVNVVYVNDPEDVKADDIWFPDDVKVAET